MKRPPTRRFDLDKVPRLMRTYVSFLEEAPCPLIKHTLDAYEKLQLLGGMASDDILAQPDGNTGRRAPYSEPKRNPTAGVYKAAMPNGKFINLMRVMLTDFCKMDCAFCPSSHWVPRKRYAFKVDELARTFMELHSRHTVDGLFLSSGVAGTGSKTTERLVKVVEIIRRKYGFKGYIHLKVMPGTEYQYVEAAHELGTRLSVNIETPSADVNGGEIMYRQGGSRAEMWRLKSVPPVAFNQERPNLTEGGLDVQGGYLPPCSQGLFRRRDERPRGGPSVRATPGHGAQDARVLRAPRVSTATTGSQTEARSI